MARIGLKTRVKLSMSVSTPLLDKILLPEDLRRIDRKNLRQIADELRAEVISAASETGGHFGANDDSRPTA